MDKPLVSLLTPSYNSAHLINRLLDSVLSQSYSNIEMIVIDDGSIDNTKNVVESYVPSFENKGYSLRYIYQANAGQSVAINNGLKLISGEYFIWPDADDFFASTVAIESLAQTLSNQTEEVGFVRCEAYYVDEETLDVVGIAEDKSIDNQPNSIFEDCLFAKTGFYFTPGSYIARVKDIDKCIPNRTIYTEKGAGQNWQLMLPLLYNRTCVTIHQKMYNILVRKSSHSRSRNDDYVHSISKYRAYERTILSTLLNMPHLPDLQKHDYVLQIKSKYLLNELSLNIKFKDSAAAKESMSKLKDINSIIPIKLQIYYYFPILSGLIAKIRHSLFR